MHEKLMSWNVVDCGEGQSTVIEIKMFNVNKNARELETVDYVQWTVDWMEKKYV